MRGKRGSKASPAVSLDALQEESRRGAVLLAPAAAESTDAELDTDALSSGVWYASPADQSCPCLVSGKTRPADSTEESLQYAMRLARKVSRSCEISEGK